MNRLQDEHRQWLANEYPDQPPAIPAAGLVEEAGELLHAVLKHVELSLWGADTRYPPEKLREQLVDAVGDCAIYACSLCNALGWDFSRVIGAGVAAGSPMELAISAVRIAADIANGHYGKGALFAYVSMVRGVANAFGIDFETAVRSTWDSVKQRKRRVAVCE